MDNRTSQVNTREAESTASCYTEIQGHEIKLVSPYFEYHLSQEDGLRSIAWKNLLTEDTLEFAQGIELEVDLDYSKQRIDIVGWKATASQQFKSDPNDEHGYQNGYANYAFDDQDWTGRITPVPFRLNEPFSVQLEDHFHWARTHVFLPNDAMNQSVTFTTGGVGLFNYAYIRVFINGLEIGVHEQTQRWTHPGEIEITPQHPAYAQLRFGGDNILALQLSGLITRTDELKEIDPQKTKNLPYKNWWPCQFEQYVTIRKHVQTVTFDVQAVHQTHRIEHAELVIHLKSPQVNLHARIVYTWNANQPTLHKFVTLNNQEDHSLMLLHVRQGQYTLNQDVSSGEQGFPVYIADQYFMTLAHPSGWAIGQNQTVTMKQYPGKWIQPNDSFLCMETVYGVSSASKARPCFIDHVQSRMRRVVRNHLHTYAIFEPFGAKKMEESEGPPPFILYESEDFLLDNLDKLAKVERQHPSHFDYYCLQFWVNPRGDLTTADPYDFPHDLAYVIRDVEALNMKFGLWIDSSWNIWSIGKNPVTQPSLQFLMDYGTEDYIGFCRASEPIHSLFTNGFLHHIRHNRVGLLKFDNLFAICYNSHHDHLSGIYSTEAIQSHVIEFLNRLDQENSDLFLMLYWGYRSPWWLLHGDTLFEPGLHLEASHPGSVPTLYVRDSVIKGLDQAHWWSKDIPQVGKDSLGVWLSDWPWNSSIGKERWQEAFLMDMFRGGLLAQPWANEDWLTESEAIQMAHFIRILREHTDCFLHARLFVGHPWEHEAYGYIASTGRRAFIVLFNCTWQDYLCPIDFKQFMADDVHSCEVYRHYPHPAKINFNASQMNNTISEPFTIAMRPFDVICIEIVPLGEHSILTNQVSDDTLTHSFTQSSSALQVDVMSQSDQQALRVPQEAVHAYQMTQADAAKQKNINPLSPKRSWTIHIDIPPSIIGGQLVVCCQLYLGQDAYMITDIGNFFANEVRMNHLPYPHEPVVRNWSLPCNWQAWRIHVDPSPLGQTVDLHITLMSPIEVTTSFNSYLILS
jgi:hypothetical protein